MTVSSPAIEWVRIVAERLGELREVVVFVGGATVGLLLTDPATAAVRPTKDVDVIVELSSWSEYGPFQDALRRRGFKEDTDEDAPLCRWVVDGIKVDVMPTAEEILGFSNRWYGPAMTTAQQVELSDQLAIRLVSPPYFVATKLEAFHGRGEGDYQLSHDIEDVVAVVDGRPSLNIEIDETQDDLRAYLREQLALLVANDSFRRALSGHLPGDMTSQARLPTLLWRLHRIAAADDEQALLRAVLDYTIDGRELPRIQQFRLVDGSAVLDELVQQGSLRVDRARYALTATGLAECSSVRANGELARCKAVVEELKLMSSSDPERPWPMSDLARRIGESVNATARAVTFLVATSLFVKVDWDAATGYVASFSIDGPALEAHPS